MSVSSRSTFKTRSSGFSGALRGRLIDPMKLYSHLFLMITCTVVASQLVGSLSEAFADNRMSEDSFHIVWDTLLQDLMRLHPQRDPLDCSPYILLRDVEKWLTDSPRLGTKLKCIQKVTDRLRNIMRDAKNMAADDKQHVDLLVGSLANFFAKTDIDAVGWFSIGDGPKDNVAPSVND